MSHVLTLDAMQAYFTQRPKDANKGLFGHVLVIGGDYGMPGAVHLAATAAIRVGAGLVTIATRPEHILGSVSHYPELLCYGLGMPDVDLEHLLERASVIILGPGLGQSTWSKQLFDRVMQTSSPLILDADGLNWLAKTKLNKRSNWILTPHPGEAARLLELSVKDIQADRERAVTLLQERYGGVAVLKGAGSLIAALQQPIHICPAGNPGMASGGMGDLLSGMIAGLVAQGFDLWQAAAAGVMFHAEAGDRVALKRGQRGLLAHDLLLELPELVNKIKS